MLETAVLTSFKEAQGLRIPAYSIAVYQPKWLPELPKIMPFDIRRDGRWTRPRDFVDTDDPLGFYCGALWELYDSRLDSIKEAIEDLPSTAALCCWCPYDKAAQRQLQEWGSFVCHSEVVGQVLKSLGVQVFYDLDRRKMKAL